MRIFVHRKTKKLSRDRLQVNALPDTAADASELDAFVESASADIINQTSNLAEALYLFQCRLTAAIRERAPRDAEASGGRAGS